MYLNIECNMEIVKVQIHLKEKVTNYYAAAET